MSSEYVKLDPANYLTAASLAWDGMLPKSKVELELICDPEGFRMIEKQMRGGLALVGFNSYAKANSKHMGDNYDETKEGSDIMQNSRQNYTTNLSSSHHAPTV